MTTARAKGAAWESALVTLLRELGWTNAERALFGTAQPNGDIVGVSGWVLEAKYRKHSAPDCEASSSPCEVLRLTTWLAQAASRSRSWRYAVLVKRPRAANPAEGFAILTVEAFLKLLREAGY